MVCFSDLWFDPEFPSSNWFSLISICMRIISSGGYCVEGNRSAMTMGSDWQRKIGKVRSFFGNAMGGVRGGANLASWGVAGALAYYLWVKPSQDLRRDQRQRSQEAKKDWLVIHSYTRMLFIFTVKFLFFYYSFLQIHNNIGVEGNSPSPIYVTIDVAIIQ